MWLGLEGLARLRVVRHGLLGWGTVGLGKVWRGQARHGEAWFGKDTPQSEATLMNSETQTLVD